MRSRSEKAGGYHAVPPPAMLYSNTSPAQKPRTRSAGAVDVSPGAGQACVKEREGEKKSRRRPARKSKQQFLLENGNGISDEMCTSCGEISYEASTSSNSYMPPVSKSGSPLVSLQRSGSLKDTSPLAVPPYKNGKKYFHPEFDLAMNNYSGIRKEASPSTGRFTSPVSNAPPRFHSDVNSQMVKDALALKLFPEHWSMSDVNEALQTGRVYSCSLRVNAHNRNEAYATIEGLSVDILIDGACAQNRAIEGDVVALRLDPPNFWPKMKGSNNNRASFTNERLVSQNHSFICDGDRQVSAGDIHLDGESSSSPDTPTMVGGSNTFQLHASKSNVEIDNLGSSGLESLQVLVKSTGRRPTGKVVAILKKSPRREAVVGFLSIKSPITPKRGGHEKLHVNGKGGDMEQLLTLTPVDSKFPKMLVSAGSLPDAIAHRLHEGDQKIGNELLAAYVDRWDSDSPLPQAVVRHCLGQAGEIEAQRAAILFEHAVHSAEFPPEAMACLPDVPWQIPEEELRKRKDLRSLRVFSIDPVTARDLDDALSVERLDNGLIRVGVHIADVSYFLQSGSDLDKEAQNRSTTVYMIQQVLPMLPRLLCEELCSLNPGVDRLAFSVIWDLTPTGDVVGQWIGRTIIRSCCKLSYGHAQDMMDGTFAQTVSSGDIPEPTLLEGVSWDEVITDIKILHSIAKQRREGRFENGALRLDTGKLVFALDGDGNPCDSMLYEHKESNMVVEEFMLLANMTVAKVISRTFPDCALLRRHPEPNLRKLKEFEEFCRKNGFHLNTESAAALHTSLELLREALKHDPVLFSFVILYATKPMQVAKYFCTGQDKDGDWGHYALATPVYTHFTSPIRRYPDVLVHRTLAAALEAEQVLQKNFTGATINEDLVSTADYEVLQLAAIKHKLPGASELAIVAAHCNERKMASKNVQDATDKLYLWAMLRRKQGLLSDACVVALGPKFMSLYVSRIAMERRLYYDEVDGLKVDWLENTGTVILDYNRPKHSKKSKGRSISEVAFVSNPASESDLEGEADLTIEPEALPLTLRLFSHIPVLIHALGGDSSPLDIGVRLYVTSYLL